MKQDKYGGYVAMGVTAFLVIAAAILLFFGIYHFDKIRAVFSTLSYILRPIFYGLVLAFLLLPIHRQMYGILISGASRAGGKVTHRVENVLNFLAVVISLALFLLVIYILLAMVLPQLYLSVVGLVEAFPGYITSIQVWITEFFENNPDLQQAILPYYTSLAGSFQQWLNTDLLPNLESANSTIDWLRQEVLPQLTGVVTSVSAGVIALLLLLKDILISLIVSVYVLVMKDTFSAQSKKIVYSVFPTRVADFIVEEVRSIYRILSGFINGKLVDSLIIGIIALLCCNFLHFPYPMLLAVIIGVTNVIPFFGPFIGAVPCALLILLVSPLQCLYFVIFIFILQQFDGNILGPKILGDSTGLASFWVLFSILLFGGLFGFAGMVLGVPVFAMFYSAVSRLVRYGLKKRSLPLDTQDYMGQTGPLAKPKEEK